MTENSAIYTNLWPCEERKGVGTKVGRVTGKAVVDGERIYKMRCLGNLKRMGIPVSGWRCTAVEDMLKDDGAGVLCTCNLCGATGVRYLHYMGHPDCVQELAVGKICAGIMEGDKLAVAERERQVRSRSGRLSRYLKRKWHPLRAGNDYDESIVSCKHRGARIFISRKATGNLHGRPQFAYEVIVDGTIIKPARGGDFADFDSAARAALEFADPPPKWL